MILELYFVTYIRMFFGHCHVTFPYIDSLSFFNKLVQKVIVSCFSESFVQKATQQSQQNIMLHVIPSFYTNYSKNTIFVSANTYEKYFVSKKTCMSRHDDKMCFLPNCRYHIILLGNVDELLKKLDTICFYYQQVHCLYTLFKYRFSGKFVVKNGQVFDKLQRADHFNQQNRGVDRMPSIAKKRLLRKKLKNHLFSSFQKIKTTQPSGSMFAERIEKVKRLKLKSL